MTVVKKDPGGEIRNATTDRRFRNFFHDNLEKKIFWLFGFGSKIFGSIKGNKIFYCIFVILSWRLK